MTDMTPGGRRGVGRDVLGGVEVAGRRQDYGERELLNSLVARCPSPERNMIP